MSLANLIGVLFLASVHLWSSKLRFLDAKPRSPWLSVAGGASLAYVFVRIFPKLAEKQSAIEEVAPTAGFLGFLENHILENHIYLVALGGFLFFYGLERFIRAIPAGDALADRPSRVKFWLHIGSFGAYNALIGYTIVHRSNQSVAILVPICIAMGLHFIVNDHSLRHIHQQFYKGIGRWVLVGSIILGWAIGIGTKVSETLTSVWFASIAGSTIVNTIKEELPTEKGGQFWPLFWGATAYTILLLLILSMQGHSPQST